MTVEIKELVIRAVVDQKDGETQENGAETAASTSMSAASSIDRDTLIQECVRQVLRILQKKEER